MSPRRIKQRLALAACLLLLAAAAGLTAAGRTSEKTAYYDTQTDAARRLSECFEAVRGYKRELGIPIEALDTRRTGMIGERYNGITTTLGAIESKRTTADPDMAALCVRLLHEAGVGPGDTVGAGFSGSFPAMNLAVLAACDAMGVKVVAISSVGASTYGANNPELTFPEMVRRLYRDGLISADSAAVTMGGDADTGGGMDAELTGAISARLASGGFPVLCEPDFQKNLAARQEIYRKNGPIDCFVAVGGNITSLGLDESGIALGQGVLSPERIARTDPKSGLVQRYLAAGLPVVNLLNIKKLVADYGMPYDPPTLAPTGASAVYYRDAYPRAPGVFALAGAAALLWVVRRLRRGAR